MESGKLNFSEISNGKWTDQEMKIILKYLQESSAKEAATAHKLNKNLIERSGISEKFNLLKWKEKNLKSPIKKSNDGLNWTGAECLNTKWVKVMEMSPQHLQSCENRGEITQSRTNVNVRDMENLVFLESKKNCSVLRNVGEKTVTLKPADVEVCFPAHNDAIARENPGMNNYSPSVTHHSHRGKPVEIPKTTTDFAEKNKKRSNPKSAAAHLTAFQAERSKMFRKKFEWERKQHEKEMEISEKKLAIEEKWIKTEMDLTRKELELIEKEIASEERLRILDMEKEERLKKYELELEYHSHC